MTGYAGEGGKGRCTAKKRVYFETAAVSYLTADKPTFDIVQLARRQLTRQWWELRDRWDLFVSSAVLQEIADGDPEAAAKRLEKVGGLPVLPDNPKTEAIASKLVIHAALPEKAQADAVHLALAALHGMDYLVTWNMRHLDKPEMREKISKVIKEQGLMPARIVSPERLMEIDDA